MKNGPGQCGKHWPGEFGETAQLAGNDMSTIKSDAKVNGHGVLREVLEAACADEDCSLSELTVLSVQVDPYLLDTAAGHRDGAWLAKQLNKAIGPTQKIHWRGLHNAVVAKGKVRKPNGEIYRNTDADWEWLSSVAGREARRSPSPHRATLSRPLSRTVRAQAARSLDVLGERDSAATSRELGVRAPLRLLQARDT
jgi:hypothetical protein